jgi:hypothetical protein
MDANKTISETMLTCNSLTGIPHYTRMQLYAEKFGGRNPLAVGCAILHTIPEIERKTEPFNLLFYSWVYQAPENYSTMWERFYDLLLVQTSINFDDFETHAKWVKQVWEMFADKVDYRQFMPSRLASS